MGLGGLVERVGQARWGVICGGTEGHSSQFVKNPVGAFVTLSQPAADDLCRRRPSPGEAHDALMSLSATIVGRSFDGSSIAMG